MYFAMFIMFIIVNIKLSDTSKKYGYMQGYVVNGVEVPVAMVPYVARLTVFSRSFCGSSIITNYVVLTAAHCLASFTSGDLNPTEALSVVVGSSEPHKGIEHKACNVISHPKYYVMKYDIGLVSVQNKFKFGINVQKIPIAIDERWRNRNEVFTLAGFGLTVNMGIKGKQQNLRLTNYKYVDSQTCLWSQTTYKGYLDLPKHSFCLIGQKWSGDCSGDSGSGVIWKKYLVGVVSAGRDYVCGSELVPSMYTNVVHFNNWIRKEVRKQKYRQCGRL